MDIIFPNEDIKTLEALGDLLGNQTEPTAVTFLKGEYYGTLFLDSLKCPTLTLNAPDGAVITGGRKIICNFKRISSNIMERIIDRDLHFERIKIDGKTKILARYPKYSETERLGGFASLKEIEAKASACASVKGAYLHSLHIHEWGGNDCNVDGMENGHLVLSWVGDNNRGSEIMESCCYIENLPELLTAENEWYYDKNSGALRIFDDSDESEKTAEVALCDKMNLIKINNCKNTEISFKGFIFADTDCTMFSQPWTRYLRSDWAFNYGSTVEIRNSKNISFSDCAFQNLGSNGIGIFDYNENITAENCIFTDCLTNGVLILGNRNSTYCSSSWEGDNHIAELENSGKTGAATNDYPDNILIDNCLFYNLGREDKQSAGVCMSLAHGVTVSRSTFCRLPRAGINICENAFGGHTVRDCDLFDCVRETGDHGPFNSWGRDRFWSLGGYNTEGEYGKMKKEYALCDMLDSNRIIHNRVVGKSGFGIDLDDGSTNYIIEDNFCFGVGIKLREGFFRSVKNNIIINAPIDLHATFEGNDDVVTGNLVYNEQPLRVIILNKGFTTKVSGNYFLKTAVKCRKEKILRGAKNNFINIELSDILNNSFEVGGFKKFSYDFGRKDAPKPDLLNLTESEKRVKIKNRYGRFVSMDESLRSLAGAPGTDGLFVERINPFSPLKKRGIKKNDVILAVNEKVFTGGKQQFAELTNGGKTEIIRQQKHIFI